MTAVIADRAETGERRIRAKLSRDDLVMRALMLAIGAFLTVAIVLPLYAMLSKSFEDKDGAFVGLMNYARYFDTPALALSIQNSLFIAIVSTAITIPLAFVYAYALTRSCMPGRALFRGIALIPILAPSLLPAISLVYLFGNQGILKALLFGESIYGPIGIVIASVFFTFPHALMILVTALSLSDARLYEAAVALRASRTRTFFTVTIPGAKYGLISATFVVFTLFVPNLVHADGDESFSRLLQLRDPGLGMTSVGVGLWVSNTSKTPVSVAMMPVSPTWPPDSP